ncbi:cytochrome c oxidase subunit II [Caldimonas brevitalea]|uniref:Cytochrome aa3 subunit 2 n=1 Tax=Caldimonas brevitalea TaxID=413882 RepID=A0A0G3BKR0_9BURK|nr:cytochrome c oxidase subunit II [Caldimonas brevitalea]AKJ30044.1 cytochrome C oxidase subunit II [Caldimonas brevitalea]
MTPGAAARASVFRPASEQAAVLAEVSWVLIVLVGVVFILTMAVLAYGLRSRKPAVATGWWVLGGGIAVPVAVLSVLLVYSTWRTERLDRPASVSPLVVSVIGRMWWWEVRYRDPQTGQELTLANELHLPVGQPVQLGLSAVDVIHSFWVPELGGKMDMVPGRVNRLMITARRAGVYRGQCAEYCGEQHARMALLVVVEPREDYERWLARQRAPAAPASSERLQRGLQAFRDSGCAACHTVRGVSDGGGRGPDLTHVGSRLTLGAGVIGNAPGAMAAWITGVQALKPGAHMASFQHLDAPELDALAAYLDHLR